jgi:hypothetical protein
VQNYFQLKKPWQQNSVIFYKKYYNLFNTKDIKFPTSLCQIEKFEKLNKHLSLKINIYGYNNIERKSELFPIKISKIEGKNEIDLLLFNDHFFFIKNFNRLVGCRGGKYHYFCKRCLQGFASIKKLDIHKDNCSYNKPKKVIMPVENEKLKFCNFNHCLEYRFVIYAG